MGTRMFARSAHFLFFCGAALVFSAGLLLPAAYATNTTNGCGGCSTTTCPANKPPCGTCVATPGGTCGATCGCNTVLSQDCGCNHPV